MLFFVCTRSTDVSALGVKKRKILDGTGKTVRACGRTPVRIAAVGCFGEAAVSANFPSLQVVSIPRTVVLLRLYTASLHAMYRLPQRVGYAGTRDIYTRSHTFHAWPSVMMLPKKVCESPGSGIRETVA